MKDSVNVISEFSNYNSSEKVEALAVLNNVVKCDMFDNPSAYIDVDDEVLCDLTTSCITLCDKAEQFIDPQNIQVEE